jgi:urease accessory protein
MAHTGAAAASSLAAGWLHPLTGADHLIAMVAVGLWASMLGQRAVWLVPAAFVAAMLAGGLAGFAGLAFPLVETAIVASLFALGALVVLDVRLPAAAAAGLVAVFALAHGHAHGVELPGGASAALYASGFTMTTALLHIAGVALGMALARFAGSFAPRAVGVGAITAGVAFLAAA